MGRQNNMQNMQQNVQPSAGTSHVAQVRYEIPILEDTKGFTHWHFCMKLALQDCGLLSVIDGTYAKPDATADPNSYADWVSLDLKAKLQIATTLHKGALNVILQASSVKDCWEHLIAWYQGKGGHCIAYLMQSFYRTMLTDTEPMEPQINKLVKANQNLKTIGCRAANNKSLAYLIVMALPESLSMLQAIRFNKDNDTVLSGVVIAQILADEECRINLLGRTATAYFAKAGKQGANGKNQDRNQDKKKCTYCKKKGHKASECFKKKKDEEKKANTSKASTNGRSSGAVTKANVAIAEDDQIILLNPSLPPEPECIGHSWMAIAEDNLIQLLDPPMSDDADHDLPSNAPTFRLNYLPPTDPFYAYMVKACIEDVDLSEKWLINSSASWIMCSNHHWFHQFTPLSPLIMITLGYNSTIPATGQGCIWVQMNTGSHYKHAMLQDVLYVLDMGGNLLLVSHFVCCNGKVCFKESKCQILDKAENTSCIRHLHRNLYLMDMKVTLSKHAKIAFVDSFLSEDDDPPPMVLAATSSIATANLITWPHCLGHLNTNAMSLMHAKNMVTEMAIT